jgi:hypothetical protein
MRLCVLLPLLNHGVKPTSDDVAVNRNEGAMNLWRFVERGRTSHQD